MLAVRRKKRRERAGLAALEILLGKAHARTDTHRLADSRWVVPPWWPRPRVGTSDCRFGPMGGGRSPPLRARAALREWGILAPLRDIIDSEWWRCSTVRKVHWRARAAHAVRTLGNVRALHRTGVGKKDGRRSGEIYGSVRSVRWRRTAMRERYASRSSPFSLSPSISQLSFFPFLSTFLG